jgi:DNA-3-methyladenine glycosylase
VRKILTKKFFERSALEVAPELLGKFLVKKVGDKEISLMITDVEAYEGPEDKASHASRGQTERNKPMFGPAGHWYVYFTYGMHWLLNIVTGGKDYPAAVLIRGTKEIYGPARITKFLKVDKKFNSRLASKKDGLWLEDRGVKVEPGKIKKCKRIGVDYAGKWANKRHRFVCEDS